MILETVYAVVQWLPGENEGTVLAVYRTYGGAENMCAILRKQMPTHLFTVRPYEVR